MIYRIVSIVRLSISKSKKRHLSLSGMDTNTPKQQNRPKIIKKMDCVGFIYAITDTYLLFLIKHGFVKTANTKAHKLFLHHIVAGCHSQILFFFVAFFSFAKKKERTQNQCKHTETQKNNNTTQNIKHRHY